MVKPKQKKNRTSGKKNQNQDSPKFDPPVEEDWIFVKKQRVTIIIPPLSNKLHSTIPSVGESQLQQNPTNTKDNPQSPQKTDSRLPCPSVIAAPNQSVQEPEKSTPSPEPSTQPPIVVGPHSEPDSNHQNPSNMSHRIRSDHSPFSHRQGKDIGVSSTSRGSRRMKVFADSSMFMNQRMRASYLEKKLKKAGGLENWLVSLGLVRFVKVFQMRRVNKFQLANLTMQKLKDMGTDAVGPRRKLMHAIDCLCEPHCFQHV